MRVDHRAWLAAAPEPEPLVVETSGSTGRPKRVLLSRRAVLASVAATERRLEARGPWVLRLPPSYVAGLMVRLRSLIAGHEPLADWPGPDHDGAWFTSLVPTQLYRMLEVPEDLRALRRAHAVLLGGGPIDPALRARAEVAGVRVVATYGAAETCGGCVYDGTPLDGVAVRIAADGRVHLGGPTLFDGYEADRSLTDEVLREGWFATSDAGRLGDDGRLQVLGRLDDVVLSGGVNVPGPAVAARLRAHPAVDAAEVIGVPDQEWGQRLVAFVVGPVSEADLRDWVGAVHPRSWAPRQIVALQAIPLLENGKPDRLRLRELAAAVR